MTVKDIAAAIEEWAPRQTAQSYDNVGLQIGRPDREVQRILVALDVTPEVVAEAKDRGTDLIVTHHPLLFRPVKSLTPRSFVGGIALEIAEAGIALYAAHTNLDAARGGVSFALADRLGLNEVDFLAPLEDHVVKLVTFVPASHAAEVRKAIAVAGAGVIGNYDACAFTSAGTGYFRPSEDSQPFIGEASGEIQSAEEIRLEVQLPDWQLEGVLSALKVAHPYEEVAYDVYKVQQPYRDAGLGAVGHLTSPLETEEFLDHIANALDAPALRYSGGSASPILRVAVCGGSGSDLIGRAAAAGAQAFVTADVTYHRFFEILDSDGGSSMLLVDAGHYETEKATDELVARFLRNAFPDLSVSTTKHRTAAMRHHISSPVSSS
ncbi:MAG: Nif3-like dinuclear metal center hexameric protein [Rhodothermia bacterium]|nr:Nif3-like dinuclear metal center hexameric protein [Rhodothermia bacterium]